MKNRQAGQVVVITGATAGVGRATAQVFAREGARIGLLARDAERLETTKQEIEQLGGHAIAISVDIADASQVEQAADRIESELGPIDIWVNNAMATVFAPLERVSAADFQRVTDVTYHGVVWGTMAALKRMRARNRGVIVQVGSALAYRSIPLQAPYCGAKHAILGFTESVRTELLHEGSEIHVTMVQVPAVNTPQFEWCAAALDGHPRPMGKVFQPEVAAKAIAWAARAKRREVCVGMPARIAIWADKLLPNIADRYLAATAVSGQQMDTLLGQRRAGNLWQAMPGPFSAHGRFDGEAVDKSSWFWITANRKWLIAGAASLALLAARSRFRMKG